MIGLTALVGCGGGETGESLGATVTGKVTLDGTPVEGATVTFRPTGGDQKGAFGRTDAEGNYTLSTSAATVGVAPGNYQVTVTKMEVAQSTGPQEGDPDYTGAPAPTPPPKSLLPEKYSKANTSGLEATVTEGENNIPLELTN